MTINDHRMNIEELTCSELEENMVILSYVDFDIKYKHLDEKTCQWIKVNFKGCQFTVKRSGKISALPADKIEIGDELLEIGKLPETLKKISVVSEPLKKELAHRGFLKFRVMNPGRQTENRIEIKRLNTEKANQLVAKVAENIKYREEATQAIEQFLDNARKGIISEREIKGFVDELFDKSSSDALAAIASLKKSDQTYGHCVDVSAFYSNVYLKIQARNNIKSAFNDEKELAFASFVHDFGKAKIPKEILDSTARFELNSPERQLMRSHPEFGLELVRKMTVSDIILNMVHLHHLKVDPSINSSYPKNVNGKPVLRETRLLSIIDAYQALIGRRSYKKSWSPAAAVRYLDALAGVEYDLSVWDDFYSIIGQYPVSSLIELSDGSVAFVIAVNQAIPESPQVVIVQDAQGKAVENHELFNLAENPDITILKDLDAQDFFGDQAIDIFTGISLS